MKNNIHMQDQVKNRIDSFTKDDNSWTLDDLAQTTVVSLMVTAFLAIGIIW